MIPLRDNINSKTKPIINWLIILANCYIFYLELRLQSPHQTERFIEHWAVIPSHLVGHLSTEWTTLLTATFLHGGWTHIIGNMLFLHVFGRSVEDRMGHLRFLIFYLGIGMFANGSQAYLSAHSNLPLLGASGAIAGVLGAYFFYYPYAKILTLLTLGFFYRIVEVPAFVFLGFWFLLQTINGAMSLPIGVKTMQDLGGVAWWAHASGFIGGLLLGPALSRTKGRTR